MILSETLTQALQEVHKELENRGLLYSKAQLAQYYETFLNRFGPQKLKSLDGEELLEAIHNHSKPDSLVYWLEFKNDEEFPSINFGSIAGGSALKFGIYKRKETGAWMTGSPVKQVETHLDEAILIARKHRDQLIAGANLLEKFPFSDSDENYRDLQDQINRVAPDVSDTAWGHKYFYLLYPEKLDDFHSPIYQRFHLIKLLQMPPLVDGRYICAGRYVAIANELGCPINTLTAILNYRNGRPRRYWRIGTKLGGVRSRWDVMKADNCVAVGWSKLPALTDINIDKEFKEKIRSAMEIQYPGDPRKTGRQTQQLFNFVAAIAEGDIVIPSDGMKVLGIGKIVGSYFHEASSDAPHRRPVEWLSHEEWNMPTPEGLQTTVTEVKKYENLIKVEEAILLMPPKPSEKKGQVTIRTGLRLSGILGRIQSVLERKGQVILYGPPGTGKTYWAELAACELSARSSYGRPYADLSNDQKATIIGDAGTVRMCCFHPAYGYEDFLEGYRPEEVNGTMVFKLRDGIFKKICEHAGKKQGTNFYLIIDEINRGDIPRIFGELLTVLEKNKRLKSILLPLTGKMFQVPNNLYIIGTMNTADRSIALLDTALRRRFGFIELMPDKSVLGNVVLEGIPLGPWIEALNRRICDNIGRDARNLQIGHSYLLEDGKPMSEFAKFARAIREDIIPLLEEYCYEDYTILEKILGKGLVDLSNQRIRQELFDPSQEDGLIQSLLAPSPEIATSPQAVTSEIEAPESESDLDIIEDNQDK